MLSVNIENLYKLQGEMSDVEFAQKLGISRTQLWRVRNRRSNVGGEFIYKFIKTFPKESIDDYFFAFDVPSNEHSSIDGTQKTE